MDADRDLIQTLNPRSAARSFNCFALSSDAAAPAKHLRCQAKERAVVEHMAGAIAKQPIEPAIDRLVF